LIVVLAGTLAGPTGADAVTPAQEVTTAAKAGNVSWTTPRVDAKHVAIVNTNEKSTASSVLHLMDSTAPMTYDFKVKVPAGTVLARQTDGSAVLIGADSQPLGSSLRLTEPCFR